MVVPFAKLSTQRYLLLTSKIDQLLIGFGIIYFTII
tara:strand:- start:56662 stop:56769 length:108 start_codon:yes stop_codon:yes gene_type:complete